MGIQDVGPMTHTPTINPKKRIANLRPKIEELELKLVDGHLHPQADRVTHALDGVPKTLAGLRFAGRNVANLLAPIPTNEQAPASSEHWLVGIGLEKMPS
jgi:hypothetical protein